MSNKSEDLKKKDLKTEKSPETTETFVLNKI